MEAPGFGRVEGTGGGHLVPESALMGGGHLGAVGAEAGVGQAEAGVYQEEPTLVELET